MIGSVRRYLIILMSIEIVSPVSHISIEEKLFCDMYRYRFIAQPYCDLSDLSSEPQEVAISQVDYHRYCLSAVP